MPDVPHPSKNQKNFLHLQVAVVTEMVDDSEMCAKLKMTKKNKKKILHQNLDIDNGL